MISEVVCREVFMAAGLHSLDAVLIEVSEAFAYSWNQTHVGITIVPGSYFGTVYIPDVYGGSIDSIDDAEDPLHLVRIWLLDCLFCNLDRRVKGNLMLLRRGKSTKLRIIPADNSDCFCGATSFSNGSWRETMRTRGGVEGVLVAEVIASVGGTQGLRIALEQIRVSLNALGGGFDKVPRAWWIQAGIEPEHIEETLWQRVDSLGTLLNIQQWGGGFPNVDFSNIAIL